MIRALRETDQHVHYKLSNQTHTTELQTLCEGQRLIRSLIILCL